MLSRSNAISFETIESYLYAGCLVTKSRMNLASVGTSPLLLLTKKFI